MEKITLESKDHIEVAKRESGHIELGCYNWHWKEAQFHLLTRAECVQLAQMLLRVSDIKTEGNEE